MQSLYFWLRSYFCVCGSNAGQKYAINQRESNNKISGGILFRSAEITLSELGKLIIMNGFV